MKCDELKVYVPQDGPWGLEPEEGGKLVEEETCYLKSEVDAAIAELKDKCQMHDFFWEGCGFARRGFKNTIAVSEAFDRLEAENKQLKAKLNESEEARYEAGADAADYYQENRRLKRALWLARAERAVAKQGYYDVLNRGISSERGEMYDVWNNVERKCLKKAEEYK